MNPNIEQLYRLAQKPMRHIIGLMSGTSLDGLDVAHCRVTGAGAATKIELLHFRTVDYSEVWKNKIRAVFARKNIDFEVLTLLNAEIGTFHGDIVRQSLEQWGIAPQDIDLVASHGQTVMHLPRALHGIADAPNATLQIGDGDHVARACGITTISDFRQKHVAAGGEGAPLAAYGDFLLLSKAGENRILLNMGGIANFTFLPAAHRADAVFTTDTGTGNTLLDATVRQFFPHLSYDKDAQLARQGIVSKALLDALLENPFFQQAFPKTTGPELFNLHYLRAAQVKSDTLALSVYDLLATLTEFSAVTIANAIQQVTTDTLLPYTVYASGGGAHNPLLMSRIAALLPHLTFSKTDALELSGDAKEAVLFAVLANECVAGGQIDFGSRQGVPSVSMGKISFAR